ncbi:FAD-dependent oxidoreductase [Agrococcus sp. SL85]|uniref:FAD-dependent oxidoreductase n=1 Tax=Agrococcus sp. SL85 TaxID=2995141 RepID=UPI00226CEF9C|nr:FAD-dependent oxidoreductase [Agrococcus sp. SL85]WAC65409.1 FAD-dependent oxidoreductase [Agrococcus sp. SL85]
MTSTHGDPGPDHATDHAHERAHGGPPPVERRVDVAVVGGSAAGLAAALQLVRQRRSVVVVDDGTPRNAPAAHMHGYLGREGAAPADLRAIGREEVRGYGAEVLDGRVVAVRREGPLLRVELTGGGALLARRVVVATGLVDEPARDRGPRRALGPRGHPLPVLPRPRGARPPRRAGRRGAPGLHAAQLLRHLTPHLVVVLHDGVAADPAAVEALVASGVPVLAGTVRRVADAGGDLSVELADGTALSADAVLTGSRFRPRVEALAPLGLEASAHASGMGEVLAADATGRTAADGVFAAGNVVDPGQQVLHAAASGSMVGAHVAFSLAADDIAAAARPDAVEAEWDARYAGEDRVWSGNPNGTLVAEVEGLAPGRALDVGAGEGADALWLAERGWRVTATDVSGRALERAGAEAARRGLEVELLRVDATAPDAYEREAFDLVSLQYGSFRRSPDGRGLANLLGAVAPGGTLLVVAHDLAVVQEPLDPAEGTRAFDPLAFVGVDEIAAAIEADAGWRVEVRETRPRPSGARSAHHVHDVVLRAVRVAER